MKMTLYLLYISSAVLFIVSAYLGSSSMIVNGGIILPILALLATGYNYLGRRYD